MAVARNLYSLTDRRHEDVLEYRETGGIAFLPWLHRTWRRTWARRASS